MSLNHANVKGENNPNYGRHPSEETIKKMLETRKRYSENKKEKENNV
jgi:hypothetical protein